MASSNFTFDDPNDDWAALLGLSLQTSVVSDPPTALPSTSLASSSSDYSAFAMIGGLIAGGIQAGGLGVPERYLGLQTMLGFGCEFEILHQSARRFHYVIRNHGPSYRSHGEG
jgi:hypothetical protein